MVWVMHFQELLEIINTTETTFDGLGVHFLQIKSSTQKIQCILCPCAQLSLPVGMDLDWMLRFHFYPSCLLIFDMLVYQFIR